MSELSHSCDHSDTTDACTGKSHDHKFFGRRQMFELQEYPGRQCHVGCASVKMVMNVCCESKIQTRETSTTWRNWIHPKSPMHPSIVSSSDECSALETSGVVLFLSSISEYHLLIIVCFLLMVLQVSRNGGGVIYDWLYSNWLFCCFLSFCVC